MGYVFNAVEDGGVPLEMIKEIIKGFEVPYFIETGTAGAHSVVKASNCFKKCHTIELIDGRTPTHKEVIVYDKDVIDEESGEILRKADPTIADHVFEEIKYPENITFHVGDSLEILPKILDEVGEEYAVYWLDAHYSDPEPSEENCVECPILNELYEIREHKNAIILIDDARLFLGTPPPPLNPDKWADIGMIFNDLMEYFPQHKVTIIDDYVVAVPNEMIPNLNNYWISTYNKRYK